MEHSQVRVSNTCTIKPNKNSVVNKNCGNNYLLEIFLKNDGGSTAKEWKDHNINKIRYYTNNFLSKC